MGRVSCREANRRMSPVAPLNHARMPAVKTFVISVLGALVIGFVLSPLGPAFISSEPGWKQHMWSHGAVAVPLLISAAIGWRLRSRGFQPTAASNLLLIGVTAAAVGQAVESASAIIEYPDMGLIHTSTGLLTMLALALIALALLGLAVNALRGKGLRSFPGWAVVTLAALGLVVLFVLAKITVGF